jgi:hypothetical protein
VEGWSALAGYWLIPLWFIVVVFVGVVLIGAVAGVLSLVFTGAQITAITAVLLNIFTYGLWIIVFILPIGAGGAMLVWQPNRRETWQKGPGKHIVPPYRVASAAIGLIMILAAAMMIRLTVTSGPPF